MAHGIRSNGSGSLGASRSSETVHVLLVSFEYKSAGILYSRYPPPGLSFARSFLAATLIRSLALQSGVFQPSLW